LNPELAVMLVLWFAVLVCTGLCWFAQGCAGLHSDGLRCLGLGFASWIYFMCRKMHMVLQDAWML
jgi:hypothetical protein